MPSTIGLDLLDLLCVWRVISLVDLRLTHDEALMRREELTLETPCQQRWSQLDGESATKRRCADCQQTVHNLSALSDQQARALLAEHAERGLCVVYVHDQHGQVMHLAPDVTRVFEASAPSRQRRGVQRLLASATLALGMLPMISACGGVNAREYQQKPWEDVYANPAQEAPQGLMPKVEPSAQPSDAPEPEQTSPIELNQQEQERRVARQLSRYGLRVEDVEIR